MFLTDSKNLDDMFIQERIEYVLPGPSGIDHMSLLELPELMRHCGLAHSHQFGNFVNTEFIFYQGIYNFEPGGITKYFKGLNQMIKLILSHEQLFHPLNPGGIMAHLGIFNIVTAIHLLYCNMTAVILPR
jgi:hypothetical protein